MTREQLELIKMKSFDEGRMEENNRLSKKLELQAKQVFDELEKFFVEQEGREDEFVIYSSEYYAIKAKFLGEKNND